MRKFVFSVALVTLAAWSCATSPTGRRQLILRSDSEMNNMGVQAFQEMKQKTPIDHTAANNAYVRCIAVPITEAARGRTSVDNWEIVVFQDPTANAFALPGGKIGVHTGIIKVAKTDAQLAAVIGHEVGHVIARHGDERVSQGMAAQGVMLGAGAIAGNSPYRSLLLGALGVGAQYGVLLPYSRDQESEADLIGEQLMAQAGFDPRESVELWKNMMAEGGGQAPAEWMSTHPADQRRIANLQAHLSETLPIYEQAKAAGHSKTCSQ